MDGIGNEARPLTTVNSYIQTARDELLESFDHVRMLREIDSFNPELISRKRQSLWNFIDSNDAFRAFDLAPACNALAYWTESLISNLR